MRPFLRVMGVAVGMALAAVSPAAALADSTDQTPPPVSVTINAAPNAAPTTVRVTVSPAPNGRPAMVRVEADANPDAPATVTAEVGANLGAPTTVTAPVHATRALTWLPPTGQPPLRGLNAPAATGCGPHPPAGTPGCERHLPPPGPEHARVVAVTGCGPHPPAGTPGCERHLPPPGPEHTRVMPEVDRPAAPLVGRPEGPPERASQPAATGMPAQLPKAGMATPDGMGPTGLGLTGLALVGVGLAIRRPRQGRNGLTVAPLSIQQSASRPAAKAAAQIESPPADPSHDPELRPDRGVPQPAGAVDAASTGDRRSTGVEAVGPRGLNDRRPVDSGGLAELARPTWLGRRRIPGIRLDDDRVIRLLASLIPPDGPIAEWTGRELHARVLARHRLPEADYRITQLRYDLTKLRAKGLVERVGTGRHYRVTKHGLKLGALLVAVHTRLLGPLGSLAAGPPPRGVAASPGVDAAMLQVEAALERLWETVGSAPGEPAVFPLGTAGPPLGEVAPTHPSCPRGQRHVISR